MLNCDIDPSSLCCRVCGGRVSAAHVRRNCQPLRPGLGDYIAAGLAWLGITKPRVEALVGGPCGCGERQEALNVWGRETLGIGRHDASGGSD